MSGDVLREYQHGRLVETVRRLEQRDEAAVEVLQRMMDPGSETENWLRQAFPNDDAYEAFETVLNRERSADLVARQFRSLGGNIGKIIGLLGLGAAGGYAASRQFPRPEP